MCTVLLPPGGYPTAVRYIIYHVSYHIIYIISYYIYHISYTILHISHLSYIISYHISYHIRRYISLQSRTCCILGVLDEVVVPSDALPYTEQ